MTNSAKRILIVDDDEDIAASVADLLTDWGYEVACASDGRKALEFLQAAETLPQLIMLDVMMPEMDAHAFRVEQQQDAKLAGIPVLLMTAGVDVHAKATELGADAYLKKPFKDLQTIRDTVARCFRGTASDST